MLIKICGITNIEEIIAVNELKPDYVGFVFAESKRKLLVQEAKELYKALNKSIRVVGVFRNNEEKEILNILNEIPLDVVQLHGLEDKEFIISLKKKVICDIWKAISVADKKDLLNIEEYPVSTLVFDSINPGNGEKFSWDLIEQLNTSKRIFLAGGINEENVLDGISKINPDGIDTSSGVEIIDEYGRRKSKDKMKILINKVREYNER